MSVLLFFCSCKMEFSVIGGSHSILPRHVFRRMGFCSCCLRMRLGVLNLVLVVKSYVRRGYIYVTSVLED